MYPQQNFQQFREPIRQPNTVSLALGILGLALTTVPLVWAAGTILCIVALCLSGETQTRRKSTVGPVCAVLGLALTTVQVIVALVG